MKQFMDQDFLLDTETARHLYHDYAEKLPIIDYHCHISPKEIYEDRRFADIAEVWFGGRNDDGSYFGDHYKWRLMRSNGIPESQVTGTEDNYQRFENFAATLEKSIGNPMYHWCHLELKKYFGFDGHLTKRNAREVWDMVNDRLKNDPKLSVRGLIEQSNVYYIGTTDDPVDTLEWHEKIAADESIRFLVRPSFRPDKAVNIHKAGFADYIALLAKSVGKESLTTTQEILDALTARAEYFHDHGCVATDHGIDRVYFRPGTMEEADAVLAKALRGEAVGEDEAEVYQTIVMLHLGRTYKRLGMAMEIHYNCLRNPNERMFALEGPDTGYDVMSQTACGEALAKFLNELEKTDELPKTIIFSLNPADNPIIDTILGAFQHDEVPGYVQHGPAWWFNDTKSGMEDHMKSLANLSVLGNFIGMLTDSRSFLSYTRHEYFRRILCSWIGHIVENGEYPADEESLKQLVEGISFNNAKNYFGI